MVNSSHQTDVRFPDSDPEEEFIVYFRQHWVRLFWPFLRCFFSSALIIAVGLLLFSFIEINDAFARRLLFFLLATFFLGVQCEFIARLYAYFLYVIIFTDRKRHRIKKTLITFNDHESIDLRSLQDIRKSQHGIVQNLLGFGSLILDAQTSQMKIHFVPRIAQCYDSLTRLREKLPARKQSQSP